MAELRTTPERRAELRRMMARRRYGVDLMKSDLAGLLDDADALAGALAAREWLRGALFAIAKADDLDEAAMIARTALAGPAPESPDALEKLLYTEEGGTPSFRTAIQSAASRRKRQRAENVHASGPRMPYSDPEGATASKDAEVSKTGRYGRNTEGAADGRAR